MTLAEMISSSWLSILCIKGTWHQKHWRKWAGCRAGSWERATAIHGVASQNFSAGFIKILMVAGEQTPCTPEVKVLKAYLLDVLRKKKKAKASRDYYTRWEWKLKNSLQPSAVWRMPWAETIFYLCHMKDRMVSFQAFGAAYESFVLHLYNGYQHEPTRIKWGKIVYIIFIH